jgi:hypothetical protein
MHNAIRSCHMTKIPPKYISVKSYLQDLICTSKNASMVRDTRLLASLNLYSWCHSKIDLAESQRNHFSLLVLNVIGKFETPPFIGSSCLGLMELRFTLTIHLNLAFGFVESQFTK